MTKPAAATRRVQSDMGDSTRSLEERLHAIRQGCRLLTDLFELQAHAAMVDIPFRMSGQGCHVLADLCRTFADDLDDVLKGIPGEIANWLEEASPTGGTVRIGARKRRSRGNPSRRRDRRRR